jgi:hypothetical protein
MMTVHCCMCYQLPAVGWWPTLSQLPVSVNGQQITPIAKVCIFILRTVCKKRFKDTTLHYTTLHYTTLQKEERETVQTVDESFVDVII